MKISENTSVSMPMKNMIGIIAGSCSYGCDRIHRR